MKNNELKAIRMQLAMTTNELSEAIDVPLRTYYGWENGRPMPDIAVRSIAMLLWMDKACRESFLNYINKQDKKADK